jgi:hypothetical protein
MTDEQSNVKLISILLASAVYGRLLNKAGDGKY